MDAKISGDVIYVEMTVQEALSTAQILVKSGQAGALLDVLRKAVAESLSPPTGGEEEQAR